MEIHLISLDPLGLSLLFLALPVKHGLLCNQVIYSEPSKNHFLKVSLGSLDTNHMVHHS